MQAVAREIEKAGFQRLTQPTIGEDFSDERVRDVVVTLRQLQRQGRQEFVERRALLRELDRLFNRKTFRFEPLRRCPEQRWADRLDSTYQTEKALRMWERNIREVAEDQYPVYVDLLKEVGSYAMLMGVHLFDARVDVARIKPHIGSTSFKAQLPPEHQFPVGTDKQPIIPDEVNDPIEHHRERAVRLMNRLQKGEMPNKRV